MLRSNQNWRTAKKSRGDPKNQNRGQKERATVLKIHSRQKGPSENSVKRDSLLSTQLKEPTIKECRRTR